MATESPKSVGAMTSDELNAWLLGKGIKEEYCTLLTKDNDVDGKAFIKLTEADLKSVGITKLGPKTNLLGLIDEAKEQENEPEMMVCLAYDGGVSKDASSGHDCPSGVPAANLPYGKTALWETKRVRVHFMNDVPHSLLWYIDRNHITMDGILKLANVWREMAHCDSVPEFVMADSLEQSDVRVKFTTEGGSYSWIGTQAKYKPTEETMVLNLGIGESNYKKHVVRHEFGHALGLGHEHQSKKAPSGLLKKTAVLGWLMNSEHGNMTEEKAKEKYHDDYERPHPHPTAIASEYDEGSIMHYWIPSNWLTNPRDHPKGIGLPQPTVPSQTDLRTLAAYYEDSQQSAQGPPGAEPVERPKPSEHRKPVQEDSGDLKPASEDEEDTQEYIKLKRNSPKLVSNLASAKCSGTLAGQLWAEGLIPKPTYDEATEYSPGRTEDTRIQACVNVVLEKVKHDRQNYYKFQKILRKIDPDYARILEE